MADSILEKFEYFKLLKNNHKDKLLRWIEPKWLVCIPETFSKDMKLNDNLASSQALCLKEGNSCVYNSEFLGSTVNYKIVGDNERKIQWEEHVDKNIILKEVPICNEYLITIKEHVVHVLLIDHLLPSMIEDDQSFLPQIDSFSITSNRLAENFLTRFRCHNPVLEELKGEIQLTKEEVFASGDVDKIQCSIHGLILQAWESLITRHLPDLQTNSTFQDLLFTALDFYIVAECHSELWEQIIDRCNLVDQMVATKINFLKSVKLSPTQLGVSSDNCTPLPAAIVEIADLNSRGSALERLHTIRDSIELIEAQAKEANALVHGYSDCDTCPSKNWYSLPLSDLLSLMVVVLVECQCANVVSNIYYITHYVFSVKDEEDPLWASLKLLRKCLELIMKLDVSRLPENKHILRKELSLEDLMHMSNKIENRLEETRNKRGSQSSSDITAMDLQLEQLYKNIHQSTQAFSETTLSEQSSPSRQKNDYSLVSPRSSPSQVGKVQGFVDFLSSLPSTIRASFRKRQSEQRIAFHSTFET